MCGKSVRRRSCLTGKCGRGTWCRGLRQRGPRPSDGGVRAGAGVLGSRLAGSRRRGPLPRWGEQATSPALRQDIRYSTRGPQGSQSPCALTVNNPFPAAALTEGNPSCQLFGPPEGAFTFVRGCFRPLSGAVLTHRRCLSSPPTPPCRIQTAVLTSTPERLGSVMNHRSGRTGPRTTRPTSRGQGPGGPYPLLALTVPSPGSARGATGRMA